MEPRSYSRTIEEVRPTDIEFRMSVRMHPKGVLICDTYAQRVQPRGRYVLWAHLDTWRADSPLRVVRSLDDVSTVLVEALMQQRLPGID